MIFVNTSLDTALQRNARGSSYWYQNQLLFNLGKDVQANIGKFSQHFRANFVVVDNDDADEDVFTSVFKQIKVLVKKKKNPKQQHGWKIK